MLAAPSRISPPTLGISLGTVGNEMHLEKRRKGWMHARRRCRFGINSYNENLHPRHAFLLRQKENDMNDAPDGQLTLIFRGMDEFEHVNDPLHKDVSAAARVGDALFTCCDETAGIDRLTPDGDAWGNHVHISLGEFLDLPAGPGGEMDIEGLMADDGWLWVVGSHSSKRGKAKGNPGEALRRLARIKRDPNRMFLGRIPLAQRDGLPMPVAEDGERRAQTLRLYEDRSELREWLEGDEHIGPFLNLPCKENGLDIEGIAARGMRVWLSLRGPVLREMAVVLEFDFAVTSSGYLEARQIDGNRRYRKHLIATRGLGIRDLEIDGDDLILLTGPVRASAMPKAIGGSARSLGTCCSDSTSHSGSSGPDGPSRTQSWMNRCYPRWDSRRLRLGCGTP